MTPSPRLTTLKAQFSSLLTPTLFLSNKEYKTFSRLVKGGKLIKHDNPEYHCDVMFVPFNPKTKEIFIVHHKKAKQWIVPGGHIEKNELLEDAVKRESREELGITVTNIGKPYLFSVIGITNVGQPCKVHYDTWFVLSTTIVHADEKEFNETKWVSIEKARKLITHKTYLGAIERMPL